jgi:hypothetical protein
MSEQQLNPMDTNTCTITPARLIRSGAHSLTGHRDTEMVLLAVAKACGETWRPVRTGEIVMDGWNLDDVSASAPHSTRMVVFKETSRGSRLLETIRSNWLEWVDIDGQLGVQITKRAVEHMELTL